MKKSSKDFFKGLLTEVESLTKGNHPYVAFWIMCSMIEFLGICMCEKARWRNGKNKSKKLFNKALDLDGLQAYKKIDLYGLLRCGLLHSMLPSASIRVSAVDDEFGNGKVPIIGAQSLLSNIKKAWEDLQKDGKCKKDLDELIFEVNPIETSSEASSISGSTSNCKSK
ncbi:MAG: hypothetical protein MJZ30_08150 [Paludibacteraceae bacterium]|nr:hypothetical protein [Paludibacteraceae bacterium]